LKASSICCAVQLRAEAAPWAQARAAAWRLGNAVCCGGQAKARLTAVQRAPRILGNASWMTAAIS
jgi:hypothetical protein